VAVVAAIEMRERGNRLDYEATSTMTSSASKLERATRVSVNVEYLTRPRCRAWGSDSPGPAGDEQHNP